MDGSDQWHTMYKTKLVLKQIASTQTDFLPKHKLLLCGYAVLKLYRTVCLATSLTVHRTGMELYTSLVTFKTFSTDQWSSMFLKQFVYVTQQLTLASVINK